MPTPVDVRALSEGLRRLPGWAASRLLTRNSTTGNPEWLAQSSAVDHGSIGGLGDDDHTHYLKEKASGGLASETPTHAHTGAAEAGTLDHGAALTGLTDDDHTQYALLAGRSGGQTLIGGTASGNKLTLKANTASGSDSEVEVVSTATGSTGAQFALYQDSSSPAANDVAGIITGYAKDANGTKTAITAWNGIATGVSAGAMTSAQAFRTLSSGGSARDIYMDPGWMFGPNDDNFWNLGLNTNRWAAVHGVIVNAGTGFRVNNAAAQDALLIGNGTNFVVDTGAWTAVSFSAGNFTASSGNWTVDSGDQATLAYRILGKTMTVAFTIITTDVSATPTFLQIAIPASKTAARGVINRMSALDAGTELNAACCQVVAGNTTIFLAPTFTALLGGGGTWSTTAADNTYVAGEITFEIS